MGGTFFRFLPCINFYVVLSHSRQFCNCLKWRLFNDKTPCLSLFAIYLRHVFVVYMRRAGSDPQLSPWLVCRNHLHPAARLVHKIHGDRQSDQRLESTVTDGHRLHKSAPFDTPVSGAHRQQPGRLHPAHPNSSGTRVADAVEAGYVTGSSTSQQRQNG